MTLASEIDVTDLLSETDAYDFSGSIAERGANAAHETWNAALSEAQSRTLLPTVEAVDIARDFFAGFGAWSRDEIASWDEAHLTALLIQFISGDVREAQSLAPGDGPGDIDWTAYNALQAEGTCSSVMFLASDGRVFAYIGS